MRMAFNRSYCAEIGPSENSENAATATTALGSLSCKRNLQAPCFGNTAERDRVFEALFPSLCRRQPDRNVDGDGLHATGRIIANKYECEQVIGRGAMGSVWRAFDRSLHRRVAIKLMAAEIPQTKNFHRRFEQEARALARLNSKNIVEIYDYGLHEGWPYIVMELLTGEDLEAHLRREKTLTPSALIPILRQIASALTAATEANIVHRDLKPANVFITSREGDEMLKLLDFGVMAWSLPHDADNTANHGLIGTPAYMSPEQLRSAAPHHLSDLWALGVITYRALTGRLPFIQRSLGELIVSVCTDPFPPPSSLVAELPADIDRFFERALSKEPTRRFQSAQEFVDSFVAVTTGTSTPKILIVDDEPGMSLLLKKHLRRRRRASPYKLLFADNGQAALDEVRRHPDIDIVLTDIRMPVMDGLSLLKRLNEVAPRVKTVMVSAFNDMDNIRRAMNLGAFDFLAKPFDLDDLDATLDKTIRFIAQQRELGRSEDENCTLRRFASDTLLERIDTHTLSSGLTTESIDGTVIYVETGPLNYDEGESTEQLMRRLNANLEIIVPELQTSGGKISRLLGNEVMAIYTGLDHTASAIEACISLARHMHTLAQVAGASSPYIHKPRIGIATGKLMSGCTGSHACNRLSYTTLGPVVEEAKILARRASPGELLTSSDLRRTVTLPFTFEKLRCRPTAPAIERRDLYRVSWDRSAQTPL